MPSYRTSLYSLRLTSCLLLAIAVFIMVSAARAAEPTVFGVVTDPSGAVVVQAELTLTDAKSGVQRTAETAQDGKYSFVVPAGNYTLDLRLAGFEPYTTVVATGDGALQIDIQLSLATRSDSMSVAVEAPLVDLSTTQTGDLLQEKQLAAVPLNGRSFTDVLALQAGVVPASSVQPNAVVMSGCTTTPPSGDLNPGNMSISGQRETANGFTVNGSIVEEDFNNGTAVIPHLDSISELTVLTSNFNAEYGNFSGGQVMVTTKSGTDQIHGSGFEFLRNTSLDSRNYFATDRATYDRNQFGGTLGGPIRKNRAYFFVDYQGTEMTQGQDTGNIAVPSVAARGGNLSDLSSQLTGSVSTDYWANQLSQRLGYKVTAGERYYSSGCLSTAQCVFPSAQIPSSVWSAPAKSLLQYIPQPNIGSNLFSDSGENEILGDHKGSARLDFKTPPGQLSSYYFVDQYTLNQPYPTAQGGANVPGFNAISQGRAQLISVGLTSVFGASTVNEARFSYMRFYNVIGQPVGGVGPSLASQGFVEGQGTLGIVPLNPSIEGVENVAFNDFTIGVDVTGERQVNNTYQWSDNYSRAIGKHTLKLGGSFHLDQVNIQSNSINNGSFVFAGTETGSDFADYLLGVASTYEQGDASAFYIRNHYIGAFAQDSWRPRSNLTLNYGIRWDVLPPWHEKYNQLQTFVLGEQSVVYPGAPQGIVFPGDPGIPATLAPTKWTNFAPRLGFSWSPSASHGILGAILGDSGKTVIKAGWGSFYTAFEGLSAGIMSACAPYGYDYDSTSGQPSFSEPFRSATTGLTNGQPFPSPIPGFGASPAHPNSTVDWSKYNPITGDPAFYYRNTSPYTESYTFSMERELTPSTVLKVGYIGNQAHHLLVLTSADPGNSQLCLSVSQPGQVMPGTPTCGPFSEGGVFTRADGTQVQVRGPFGPSFDGITYQKTVGFSNYNALEVSLRHSSRSLQINAAYTYGKSLDDSSSLSEPVYPFNAALTKAISAFDMRHNFVVSYDYQLPLVALFHRSDRLTDGWSLSGVTRFSSGLPVTLYNNTDSSLEGSMPNGINNNGVDTPYYTLGNLQINTNPRNNQAAFNTALFATDVTPYLGQIGNAPRRFFYGPGLENFDVALQKMVKLGESTSLQFRMEAFNVFNHAQFFGAAAVNGNISSVAFGQIVNAMPPRQVQFAVKFSF
ncbi:MAG TPA: carboxypeptidase-like regulatory domain-containing protein [Candidatus Angelobacter sp.]|nr:carboxypeptidase-like regulatory domain-containing protein [Candidatus Angelobacter sp.]